MVLHPLGRLNNFLKRLKGSLYIIAVFIYAAKLKQPPFGGC